jgi:hypothetical protein
MHGPRLVGQVRVVDSNIKLARTFVQHCVGNERMTASCAIDQHCEGDLASRDARTKPVHGISHRSGANAHRGEVLRDEGSHDGPLSRRVDRGQGIHGSAVDLRGGELACVECICQCGKAEAATGCRPGIRGVLHDLGRFCEHTATGSAAYTDAVTEHTAH